MPRPREQIGHDVGTPHPPASAPSADFESAQAEPRWGPLPLQANGGLKPCYQDVRIHSYQEPNFGDERGKDYNSFNIIMAREREVLQRSITKKEV